MAGMFIIKRAVALSTFHYGSIKILTKLLKSLSEETSTFHYGSIKIKFNEFILEDKITSTFHYGSIKILMNHRYLMNLLHLHSTMVLLKSAPFGAFIIPTLLSTFHYGSIKIRAYKTLYIMLFIASYFVDLK